MKNIHKFLLSAFFFACISFQGFSQEIAQEEGNDKETISTTSKISIQGVNFEDISDDLSVERSTVQISNHLTGTLHANIYNTRGKVLKSFDLRKTNDKTTFALDTKNLKTGVYILEISKGKQKGYKRIYL